MCLKHCLRRGISLSPFLYSISLILITYLFWVLCNLLFSHTYHAQEHSLYWKLKLNEKVFEWFILDILGEQEQVITMLNNCYLVIVVYQHSTHVQSVLISTKYGNLSLLTFWRQAISTGHPGFQLMYNTTMSVILPNINIPFVNLSASLLKQFFSSPPYNRCYWLAWMKRKCLKFRRTNLAILVYFDKH